jgi:hypothetical protein
MVRDCAPEDLKIPSLVCQTSPESLGPNYFFKCFPKKFMLRGQAMSALALS